MLSDLNDPQAVIRAIEAYDVVGRDAFLAKYGFRPSTRYLLEHEGRSYDSKAIAAVAHEYQFGTALRSEDFVGGLRTVVPKLQALGFRINEIEHTFEPGALYNRTQDIHDVYSGQKQGGISTPLNSPFVFLFTGAVGQQHGYDDFWDDEDRLHYYGEGQAGDMKWQGGNRAIGEHKANKRRLLLFQPLGKSKPCRFVGEFFLERWYEKSGVLDTSNSPRNALVFVLERVEGATAAVPVSSTLPAVGPTTATRETMVRTKQSLFRDRLMKVELCCRITGISDARFLRASHIKPWSESTDEERVDPSNGLLLSPNIDHLFNDGWLTFSNDGKPIVSGGLEPEIAKALCGDLAAARRKKLAPAQCAYLDYHRRNIFKD